MEDEIDETGRGTKPNTLQPTLRNGTLVRQAQNHRGISWGGLYKKKRKQEPADFRNAIKYSAKVDQIIAVLKQMMEGKTQARDIIRPIRAAMDIGLIRRPTFREFIETFHPEVHIAKSTFSDYTNPDNAPFVGDDLYDNIKEELLTI